MKSDHAFIAASRAARHCPELIRRGPDPADLLPALGQVAPRLIRSLAAALAPLCGGEAPSISADEPRRGGDPAALTDGTRLTAHCGFAAAGGTIPLLASLDAAPILRMVDRTFGGKGETPSPLPDQFPPSASLLIERLATMLAERLGEVLGTDLAMTRLGPDLDDLAIFTPGSELATLRLAVMEGMRAPWDLTLALPLSALPALLGNAESRPQRRRRAGGAADPLHAPFGQMPLPLTAVLIDMTMPLSAIAALTPGQILPVAVARSVPLQIAGQTLCTGTVGTQDDRAALLINQLA